ncbi:MAG: hypothetical protein LBQ52_04895 [Helicobacteraceae bacterium]|nr:hypothetical protein [Helicobacteraceae bacterium]
MEKTLIEQGIAAKKVKAEVKKAAVRLWLVYERRIETLRMAFYFIVTVAVRFLLVEFSNLRIAIAATIMIVSAILANKARLALVNYAKLAFPDIDERKDRK